MSNDTVHRVPPPLFFLPLPRVNHRLDVSFYTLCVCEIKFTLHGMTRKIYLFIYLYFYFLAMPRGLWDFSSPARDQIWALGSESAES